MAGSFTGVNLGELPPPNIVEPLSFESIFQGMLADLRARDTAFNALVESDPAYKLLEVAAYRELLIRQRVNEAARAVMVAYAVNADLDQLAANFDVARLVIEDADPDAVPPKEAVMESDTDFRRRILLSMEGHTTAGSIGSYIFHALSASGDCKDAAVASPVIAPGRVDIAILSRTGNGAAPNATLDAVHAALNAEEVRPLCDTVRVQSATIIAYSIQAVLTVFPGAGQDRVLAAANAAAQAYTAKQHALGLDVTRSGVFAALHVAGVQNVNLISPGADVAVRWNEAPHCTSVALSVGGEDE